MFLNNFILILFIFKLGHVKSVSNGCGSKITIDYVLQLKGLQDLIPCCNEHDECYDTCNVIRAYCDNNFADCLNFVCNTIQPVSLKPVCSFDAKGMTNLVKAFGNPAFLAAQYKQCRKNHTSSLLKINRNFLIAILLVSSFFYHKY